MARVRAEEQGAFPDALSDRDLAGRDQRFQHLLNEERISLSQRVHAFYQTSRYCLVHGKDGPEHRIDFGTGESLQGEVLGQMLPVKFGQAMPQLWRHFVTAVGQHKQDEAGAYSFGPGRAAVRDWSRRSNGDLRE